MALHPSFMQIPKEWSPIGLFDDQVSDPWNFGLGENAVSVLSALFTGVALVLIADICLRLVVRSRRSIASSRAVHRRALFARFANPLEGVLFVLSMPRKPQQRVEVPKQAEKMSEAGMQSNTQPNSLDRPSPQHVPTHAYSKTHAFPRWQTALIFALGALLLCAQFLLIFLATNREVAVHIDTTQIPSFGVADKQLSPIFFAGMGGCNAAPLVSKHGFISLATAMVCTNTQFRLLNASEAELFRPYSQVLFQFFTGEISIKVTSGPLQYVQHQASSISIANGTRYTARSNTTREKVRAIVPPIFARFGLRVARDFHIVLSERSWAVSFLFVTNEIEVPAKVVEIVRSIEDIDEFVQYFKTDYRTFALIQYLSAISSSAIGLYERGRAYNVNPRNGPFLDQAVGEVLVTRVRPWLGIGGCIIFCGASLVVWMVLAVGLEWGPGQDDRIAWVRVFPSMTNTEELGSRPDEKVEV